MARDQWLRREGYNSEIRMTNVKNQMTNQIQMIKCLNDSVKNPVQRSGLHLRSFYRKPLSLLKAKVGLIWGLSAQIPLAIQSRA